MPERVTTGSEPRRWRLVGEDAKSPWAVLAEGPLLGWGESVEVQEVEPGHDEQTEDLKAVLRRNGRPDTAPELQADFERRQERAIRDWAPYVGHAKDGKPIYHADTVAAVVEALLERAHVLDNSAESASDAVAYATVREDADFIEERFKPSAPGGGNG